MSAAAAINAITAIMAGDIEDDIGSESILVSFGSEAILVSGSEVILVSFGSESILVSGSEVILVSGFEVVSLSKTIVEVLVKELSLLSLD